MSELEHNYIFNGRNMVVRNDGCRLTEADIEQLASLWPDAEHYTEQANSISVLGVPDDRALPEGFGWTTVRSRFADMDDEHTYPIARAKALLEWRRNARYCGHCGSPLVESKEFTAMDCPKCGNQIFPRINPCVIMLVSKGDEILLARHAQRNQDVYTCLAGFVEAGESIEHAVRREIMEETGITVKNIKYYGSQSWPFPAQLMFGFTAEYESGTITPQPGEIADAQWFHRSNCPATPPKGSIAYKLIHGIEN
ncbi:MAG: NAD(+) diphosphatase [Bacteroidales bacterium]|nr:NAD(+) diphosphatase [Bacteroidales bacterium]